VSGARSLVGIGLAVAALLAVAPPASADPTPDGWSEDVAVSPPADARRGALLEAALGSGAFGAYMDDLRGELVVVFPKDSAVREGALAGYGAEFRIELSDLTTAEMAELQAQVTEVAANADMTGHGYASYFDAERSVLVVEGDLRPSAFAKIVQEHPGSVEYRVLDQGFRRASRNGDTIGAGP
jgi:hypothetical protein